MVNHDGGYKLLFSHPRMVEELLRGFVHEPWVAELDFETLEQVRASVVSDDLEQRHMDVVWRLRWRGSAEWFYVYLLIEFQSTPDPFMAVRLLGYVGLLLGEILRSKKRRRLALAKGLPAVLPLVLYNGRKRWNAPQDLASLFRRVPPGAERYLPQLHYLLVDESRLQAADLDLPDNRVATLFKLETAGVEDLPHLTAELAAQLPPRDEPELRRAFTGWVRYLLHRLLPEGKIPPEIHDLGDVAMLEETLLKWNKDARKAGKREGLREGEEKGRKKGLQEGEKSGRKKGMRSMLLRLLAQRFGKLPLQVRRQVAALRSASELERLLDRALVAGSLEELESGG